jgi:hypothetical protein
MMRVSASEKDMIFLLGDAVINYYTELSQVPDSKRP